MLHEPGSSLVSPLWFGLLSTKDELQKSRLVILGVNQNHRPSSLTLWRLNAVAKKACLKENERVQHKAPLSRKNKSSSKLFKKLCAHSEGVNKTKKKHPRTPHTNSNVRCEECRIQDLLVRRDGASHLKLADQRASPAATCPTALSGPMVGHHQQARLRIALLSNPQCRWERWPNGDRRRGKHAVAPHPANGVSVKLARLLKMSSARQPRRVRHSKSQSCNIAWQHSSCEASGNQSGWSAATSWPGNTCQTSNAA